MKNRKLIQIKMLVLMLFAFILGQSASAVAFKLENSTKYKVRAKVFDRGHWRSYVSINPGECVVFGSKVERTEHDVIIQMYAEGEWKTIYKKHHGSRVFTRLVHVQDSGGKFYFSWWDEPPGCRDCPSEKGCLRKSDWLTHAKDAYKIGVFLGKVVMVAGG